MEDIAQDSLIQSTELLKSLAKEHQVPLEIAEQMAVLMQQYPDLSIWGSESELTGKLERVLEYAFKNKVVGME
ncbi:DNA modification system-associated small protein [Methylomonas sp. OY6]|uniref:DNA modification system-associated small protein n=1 Tax=Methylomonas defluvii TaxID=3045149 RepID=A0ABU4UHD3_9GAMM|nr:DNA modification system-associated small protein [Methylomonas sp. OY6]MDX8128724.1 DNA modification system-associated small protein [Methylomonas sp. OY6]